MLGAFHTLVTDPHFIEFAFFLPGMQVTRPK
jgi:hypothetical protein